MHDRDYITLPQRGLSHRPIGSSISRGPGRDQSNPPAPIGLATLFRDRERDVAAQLVVSDSKSTITLARSSADVSSPYGFMLLPGTTSSGVAMKGSSLSLSHTKSAPIMAPEQP